MPIRTQALARIALLVLGTMGRPAARAEAQADGLFASAVLEPEIGAATIALDVGPPAAVGDCGSPADDCWTVGSVVTVAATISVAGHSGSCSKTCLLPVNQDFLLRSNATYDIEPGLGVFCPRTGGFVPLNTGTITPGPRGKLLLVPDNIDQLDACVTGAKFSSWVRPSVDETKLAGNTVLRGRTIFADGKIVSPPAGRLVKPCPQ